MQELHLDAAGIKSREMLYDQLTAVLQPQDAFGRNLDALYDLLTTVPATRLTLLHPESLIDNLGNYGELVLRVLADASAENPEFQLIMD